MVYAAGGKLYSWNAAQGSSTLRADVTPSKVVLTGRDLYAVMGASQTLYRIRLD